MEHFFFRNSGKDQKKKQIFIKNFPDLKLRPALAHQSQIIGGDADEDHNQIIGGYIPTTPRVSAPLLWMYANDSRSKGALAFFGRFSHN